MKHLSVLISDLLTWASNICLYTLPLGITLAECFTSADMVRLSRLRWSDWSDPVDGCLQYVVVVVKCVQFQKSVGSNVYFQKKSPSLKATITSETWKYYIEVIYPSFLVTHSRLKVHIFPQNRPAIFQRSLSNNSRVTQQCALFPVNLKWKWPLLTKFAVC